MTDANAKTPTDAGILSLAYDCSALPETITDAALLVFARAVLAKWGAQPVAAPAGMQPVARIRYERNTPGRENEMPRVLSCNRMADGVYEVFTASQVQAMLTAVPRNAPLYDPDEVAFSARCCADGTDVPPELASIAAAEVAAPSGAAREPLTEEQMHKDLAALCKRIFNARIGKACSNCDGGTYQSDNNGYGQFHRCNKCCYVPMWGEDGRELGAPIAATQKGGQHEF